MKTGSSLISSAAAAVVLALLTAVSPAQAVEKGDWLFRAGVGHVAPNDSSTDLTGAPGGNVAVGSSTNLALNFTYMFTDNWGFEVLGALPFAHDISGSGNLSGAGTVIETDQLPPTFMAIYNFDPKSNVRPYVGVGINYTTFMDETGVGALAGTSVKLDDSTGLALEAGVDVDINSDLYFNASLWYIDIETEATTVLGTTDVDIDPWVLFLGVGWKF